MQEALAKLWAFEEREANLTFGDTISQARESRNLTQFGLAEKIGVSKNTVTLWEIGKRSPRHDKLAKLSSVLDLPLDLLEEKLHSAKNGDCLKSVGSLLKSEREKAGLSIKKLARLAGLSYRFISRLEQNEENPNFVIIRRLASILDSNVLKKMAESVKA